MLLNTTKQKYNEGYKHFGKIGDVWKHLPLCMHVCIIQSVAYEIIHCLNDAALFLLI